MAAGCVMCPDNRTAWLIGTWQVLRSEAPLEIEPGTRMAFSDGGALQYTIPTAHGPVAANLRWHVVDAVLHTVLDDGTNATSVHIVHGDGDTLMCDFGGPRAWYIRVA
jgi:hypothetical protein